MYLNLRSSKKLITPVIFLMLIVLSACKKNNPDPADETIYETTQEYNLQNVPYGTDSQQKMDIYLPANRNSQTKVFVLIHGGGWSGGDKADFTYLMNSLKTYYPDHAVININYRLATQSSPAFPKQLDDIQAALTEISLPKYSVSSNYFLFGASAGGHLSLLYSYGYDPNHCVKGICNTVGPSDLTDPNYLDNPLYSSIYPVLINGGAQNQAGVEMVSPALRVTSDSPPTISFYGDSDPLVPATQMALLHNALNAKGVYNQATMYQGAGHGNWNQTQSNDCIAKILVFVNTYFP
ncbi:alpha/beta hydrolase [Fluviicola chungangensis]|uniref:Alpha/beta hydrolase n=1 Tax=Fluviicola chungangensis TaxID=2597671 RepID=A0A556MYR7_9FLAO|nr:alpha/beta hydrolase [Fluviicola chungangensis]TSJ44939.1 alpha/beta hydrolase [Fluviicola chungangensis]